MKPTLLRNWPPWAWLLQEVKQVESLTVLSRVECKHNLMNFVRKSLNSLVKLQQMFRIAEIELGMENTIGITLETGVGVQSAILHVCPEFYTWELQSQLDRHLVSRSWMRFFAPALSPWAWNEEEKKNHKKTTKPDMRSFSNIWIRQ